MAILDIFKRKDKSLNESNTVLGQMQLGNQVVYGTTNKQTTASQLLYVTTSSTTTAGRAVDMSALTRNSTVMACVGVKARSLAQCSISIMTKLDD
jgi:phage portal protein BeeE